MHRIRDVPQRSEPGARPERVVNYGHVPQQIELALPRGWRDERCDDRTSGAHSLGDDVETWRTGGTEAAHRNQATATVKCAPIGAIAGGIAGYHQVPKNRRPAERVVIVENVPGADGGWMGRLGGIVDPEEQIADLRARWYGANVAGGGSCSDDGRSRGAQIGERAREA